MEIGFKLHLKMCPNSSCRQAGSEFRICRQAGS
jgi:hypothetical protein